MSFLRPSVGMAPTARRGADMRKYLVSGFLTYGGGATQPMAGTAVLEDHEIMDLATVGKVQHILLLENNRTGTIATSLRITSFQPFETPAAVQPVPAPAVHLNPADFAALPPVDSPLLIEIAPGVLVLASRPAHAEQKGDDLRFDLPSGGRVVGRFRWTHA